MWGYDVDIEVTDWRNNKAPLCLHFVWTIDLKRCRSLCDLSLLTKLSSLGSVTTMRPYLYLKQLHNLINTYWINSPTHTSWLMHRHPLRPRFLKLIFRISKSLFFFQCLHHFSSLLPKLFQSIFFLRLQLFHSPSKGSPVPRQKGAPLCKLSPPFVG